MLLGLLQFDELKPHYCCVVCPRYGKVCTAPIWSMSQSGTFFRMAYLKHVSDRHIFQMQAATNPLFNCPGQLKIHLANQKFKVLCPNGQLKSKQGTECELKFCNCFWYFNWCGWHFISKQVEGDSFDLICRQYVPKQREGGCYKVLQAILQHHQILGSKSRAQSGNWFTVWGCPIGLPLEKKLLRPVQMHACMIQKTSKLSSWSDQVDQVNKFVSEACAWRYVNAPLPWNTVRAEQFWSFFSRN